MTAPPPVEARSLSSLTQLFANPPQYPRNPTHQPLEPLVLYIVRVPGSRDVFLTPLKPPTKASIGADAIQSCLYYCHVNTSEDENVRKSAQSAGLQQRQSKQGLVKTVYRKPLLSSRGLEKQTTRQRRKPVPQSASASTDGAITQESSKLLDSTASLRKPLGPRPQTLRPTTSGSASVSVGHERAAGPTNTSGVIGNQNGHPVSDIMHAESGCGGGNGSSGDEHHQHSVPTPPDESPKSPPNDQSESVEPHSSPPHDKELDHSFAVTIVRRDPASGAQWNVGTLQTKHRTGGEAPGRDSWQIEVTNPGYQKFAGQLHMGKRRSASRNSEQPINASKSNTVDLRSLVRSHDHAGMGSRPSRAAFTTEIVFPAPATSRKWSGSFPSSFDSSMRATTSAAFPRLTFDSPWHGTCVFATGLDGRSLKCRHHLPSVAGSGSGDGGGGGSHDSERRDNSALVAEVRFNLPWSVLRSQDTNINASTERERKPVSVAQLRGEVKNGFQKGMARLRQDMRASGTAMAHPGRENTPPPLPSVVWNSHSQHAEVGAPPLPRRPDHPSSTTSPPSSSSARRSSSLPRSQETRPNSELAAAGAAVAGADGSPAPFSTLTPNTSSTSTLTVRNNRQISPPAPEPPSPMPSSSSLSTSNISLYPDPNLPSTLSTDSSSPSTRRPFTPPSTSTSTSTTFPSHSASNTPANTTITTTTTHTDLLPLGREDAGGGRKGTSAKLGKLILYDEGLKMADLVVAAAVGVWWGRK